MLGTLQVCEGLEKSGTQPQAQDFIRHILLGLLLKGPWNAFLCLKQMVYVRRGLSQAKLSHQKLYRNAQY